MLLARGDTWTQSLHLSGSGTSAAWITLGAYGSGNRPVISGSGNATDRTVVLTDPDHWHVQDLELTHAGEGLLVMYSTLGHQGLDVHGVYAHDLAGIVNRSPVQSDFPQLQYSTGILVDASSAPVTAAGQTVVNGVSIHDNAYDATPQGLVNDVDGSPEIANITQSGNTVTTAQYVAPLPFNGEQGRGGWSQQAYDLSSWQNLTAYDAPTNTWTGLGGSFVNAFQLRPGSGQTSDAWVARTWTAPATGTVTVHGRIFKDDADNAADTDGVHALIEHNGTAVWPSAPDYVTYRALAPTDRSGYATDVTLQVTAGDVIRFVVTSDPGFSNAGDTTSWSPSISYTS
ncbi:hypothetical protein [Streptomyces sp. NPDC021020]|uniref:hypothetical protein n=1 Tax=Streptomyces sp. NPDC021020 TaxID=3365109 RepID=UPI0037930C4F